MEGMHQSIVFLGPSDTNSNQCSHSHKSTGSGTCIFIVAISKPCAEARGLQKHRIRFIAT